MLSSSSKNVSKSKSSKSRKNNKKEKKLEDLLFVAIRNNNYEKVKEYVALGANPCEVILSVGKTCLGEAAKCGNRDILKLLVDMCPQKERTKFDPNDIKRSVNPTDLYKPNQKFSNEAMTIQSPTSPFLGCKIGKSLDYKVYTEKASYTRGGNAKRAPIRSGSVIPTPHVDLEWDEEIGNAAPVTSDDVSWCNMYRWYADILEETGGAIAQACSLFYGIDQQDVYKHAALHYAAEHGHNDCVRLLMHAGCNIHLPISDGATALHIATIHNREKIVKTLLKGGARVDHETHENVTPLHFAASRGLLNMVKLLIENGANLEARDTHSRTPLYMAVLKGRVDVVTYLVEVGANVNTEQSSGHTALCEAVWQRNATLVEFLLKSGARFIRSFNLLHNSVMNGEEEIVKILAKYSGDTIDGHKWKGETPLMVATRESNIHMATLLLKFGSNINTVSSVSGTNVVHIAIDAVRSLDTFKKMLLLFLDYKVNIDCVSLPGDTPVNRAFLLDRDDIAVMLIKHGADVNAGELYRIDLDNLSMACSRSTPKLANLVFKAGFRLPSTHYSDSSHYSEVYPDVVHKNPFNLTDICRLRIRNLAKDEKVTTMPLYKYIDSLVLPSSLKGFLMFESGW